MDISFLAEYAIPVIVGICLCVGYILKHVIQTDAVNRFIPLILGCLGLILNIWANGTVDPNVILGGLFSGLAATGLHEAFRNLINKQKAVTEDGTE